MRGIKTIERSPNDFVKSFENKLRHNCPICSATYTLLETHLTKKDNQTCSTNCRKTWQTIIHKYCQEKALAKELERENKEDYGSN